MDDQRLKKSYLTYIFAAILFTVTLSSAVVVQKYSSEMRDTVDKLKTLSGSSVRVKRATQSAHDSIGLIKKEIPAGYLSSPTENLIFQTVDTIRESSRNAEVVIESTQDQDNEVGLPIIIKGALDDYASFVGLLHFLESLRFPFFSTSELIMTNEADKQPSYEIKGSIRALKPPDATGNDQQPQRRRGN